MALAVDSLLLQGVENVVTQFSLQNKVTLDVWVVVENNEMLLKARVLEAPQSEPFLLQSARPQNFQIISSEFQEAFRVLYRNGATIQEANFVISIRCFTYDPEQCPKPGFWEGLGNFSRSTTGKIITYTAMGVGVAAAAVPIGLSVAGFGAAGVVGGSFAAGVQASIGNVAAGSFFALCQSMGATGAATMGLWGLATPALLIPRAFGSNQAETRQNHLKTAVEGKTREQILEILKLDEFPDEEIVLFEAACCWAQLQCEPQKLEVTPTNIRLVLGPEMINLIRFPAMSPAHFNDIVVPTGILTDVEVAQIQPYFQRMESASINLESNQISTAPFNSQRRWQGIRLFKGSQAQGMTCPNSQQKIIFSTSHPMKIESFGFLGPFSTDSEYRVELHIGTRPELENIGPLTVSARQKQIFHVNLPNPFIAQPFEEYVIKYRIIGDDEIQRPEQLTVIQDCLQPQVSYLCVGESDNGILAEISCRSL